MSLFPPEIADQSVEGLFVERHSRTQVIYVLVLMMVVVGFGVLPFVRVDITAHSRGIIRTEQENNQVAPAFSGRIARMNITLNQPVAAGDTLVILNTDKIDEEMAWHIKQIEKNETYIKDLGELLSNGKNIYTLLYKTHRSQYLTAKEKYQNDLLNTQREYRIHKKLFAEEVISTEEFKKKEYQYQQAQNAFQSYQEQSLLQWRNDLEQCRQKKLEHQSMVERLQKERNHHFITAPVSGKITQYSGLQAGNYVVPNQVIAEISPENDLLVECYLSPADIGMIHDSMDVRFQLDAFHHNQWGLAHGKVKDISPDIFMQNNQPFFKVRCHLQTNELQLKNGYKGKLRKGMTLNARFRITERTLFQLLYDKVDDWLNPHSQNITATI